MVKASRKKTQQELQSESILNGKSLISSELSSKWSLFNKPIVHFFLIAIVGFLVYSNTFHVPFHFDDHSNIVENYKLRDLSNFWPPSGSRWFGFITFALNYHFGGLNTIGYHIINLVIHIFNASLVYWLVVLTLKIHDAGYTIQDKKNHESGIMSRASWIMHHHSIALFSALLFVSHPIQTQAVTYIVQRFTSLATMFYLLSLVMYIKARLEVKAKVKFFSASTLTFYIFSLISAILAMKTKEIAFTLPVVIALYEFMFFEGNIKKRMLYLIPILLTILVIPLSMIGIDKPVGDTIGELREAAQETEEIPRWSYLFTQFKVIVTYIRLLFFPINQNLDYDYPVYHSFFNPEVFLSFLFLLLIFAFGIYLFYAKRYTLSASRFLSFGILWFFITLSVESSIIPIRDVINEHRLYLPSLGIIIVFVSATFYILQAMIQNPKRSLAACYLVLATAVIVLSIATYERNNIWQDEVSLWEDVVRKSPNKARAYIVLGWIYKTKGQVDKAIEYYKKALKLPPANALAHNNLGNAYYAKGWIDESIQEFKIAIRLNSNCAEAYYNLGIAYKDKGLTDMAIEQYQIALKLNPDYAEAHMNMANAYDDKGMTDKAIEHYQIALKLNPDYAEAHYNLGVTYGRRGLLDEAIKQYQTALRLNPGHKLSENNLNRILQIQRSK